LSSSPFHSFFFWFCFGHKKGEALLQLKKSFTVFSITWLSGNVLGSLAPLKETSREDIHWIVINLDLTRLPLSNSNFFDIIFQDLQDYMYSKQMLQAEMQRKFKFTLRYPSQLARSFQPMISEPVHSLPNRASHSSMQQIPGISAQTWHQ
jgi:hypothetical protein